jgi:hypothetical protein
MSVSDGESTGSGVSLKSEFRVGATAGRSYESASAADIYTGEYDVLICVSGWDERAISVLGAESLRADLAIVITFEEKDQSGYRERHDAGLLQFLPTIAKEVVQLEPSAAKLEDAWQMLYDVILRRYIAANRSLRIAMDCSVCPRYLTLSLLGLSLSGALASEIDIFYAEGFYPEKPELAEVSFTAGPWRTITVPGMEGSFHPGSGRYYLISVGFEGHKTLRVVNTADPDRISILLPDPGTRPDYVERALSDNRDLIESYRVPEDQIVRAAAGDAIGAWKLLAEANLERFDKENIYYLCSGTKAHSIALALRALTQPGGAVLYNVPERYSAVVVKPSNVYWRYNVQNLAAPIVAS